MYANDHQAYASDKIIKDIENILNNERKEISHWYKDNLLMCNHEQFQSMSLGPKHKKLRRKLM